MPKKLSLAQIAKKNPHLDLQKIEEWNRLREVLIEGGLHERRRKRACAMQEGRARLVDDPENDPRLITLQK